MDAQIINMHQWKAAHTPILKLWQAQCRFASEWSVAWFRLALSLCKYPV